MSVRWASLVAVTVALGGCMLVSNSGNGTVPSSSCARLPGGVCREQTERLAGRHPGATQVDLTCSVPVCNRAGGAITAIVTLADRATVTEAFAYRGDPNPLPNPACTAIAALVCRGIAASVVDDQPPSNRVTSVSVTCTALPCTEDKGDAQVVVDFVDGTQVTTAIGWDGGLP